MAKNKVSEWSATPANNTDIGGIDIAEGCAPSGINNAIREMMAQLKDQQSGTDADNFTVGGNLIVSGTATGVTPSSSDDSTKFATTEWVQDKVGTLGTMSTQNANSVAITGGSISIPTMTATTKYLVPNGSAANPSIAFSSDGANDTGFFWNTDGNINISSQGTELGYFSPSGLTLNGTYYGNGAGITGTANSLNAGIGVNQTWQSVKTSRSVGTTYTNTTGKPIMVFVNLTSNAYSSMVITVNGLQFQGNSGGSGEGLCNTVLVPNGGTYSASLTSGSATIQHWNELR